MNNFIKLNFISNRKINHNILHSLYTTIRFKKEKILNLKESFKVWNEGRNVFIIMEESKIENSHEEFEFEYENEKIKFKLFKKEKVINSDLNTEDYVKIYGVISYAYKEIINGKVKEICPVDFKGNIKNKEKFANYLTNKTGLDFNSSISHKDRVVLERLYLEDVGITNEDKETKSKVLLKNLIMVNAIVKIQDVDKARELYYSSIGKKRSYGVGNLIIEKVSL